MHSKLQRMVSLGAGDSRVLVTLCYYLILTFSRLLGSDYESCQHQGGQTISQVFCLPKNYRKDVLPPRELKL